MPLYDTTELLATPGELLEFLQEDSGDTAELTTALAAATAAIQTEARQHIFYVADDTVTLRLGTNSRLLLPERPAVAVSSVSVAGAALMSSAWDYQGDELMLTPGYGAWWGDYVAWGVFPPKVAVTYSHGYQTIPNELAALCVSVAARSYSNPQGLRGERIGGYDIQYAGAGDILVPGVALSTSEQRTVHHLLDRRRVATQMT